MRSKTKEGLQMLTLLALGSLVAALPLSWGSAARKTGEADRAVRGAQAFGVYCASCHGVGAGGNGPMAPSLKVAPADLTRIRERYGAFPEDRIADIIDGRRLVLSHGPAEMPVWGMSFQDAGRDLDQEQEVQEKIRDLVAYLASLQK